MQARKLEWIEIETSYERSETYRLYRHGEDGERVTFESSSRHGERPLIATFKIEDLQEALAKLAKLPVAEEAIR